MVDVHAHWIPGTCFEVPGAVALRDRGGELHYGSVPLQLRASDLSDPQSVIDRAGAMGVTLSVVSPPPITFALGGDSAAADYCATYNAELEDLTRDASGRVAALGIVPLGRPDEALAMLEGVGARGVLAGIAIPPMLGATRLDQEPMRSILRAASRLSLSVLVHPMQLPAPGLDHHYLQNLLGNPVETTGAIAAVLLGGVMHELPDLRILFVHGGGAAPALLGRWDHGWEARADVRSDLPEPPSRAFRRLYVDTIVHGTQQLRLLAACVGDARLLIGSDAPFDMADHDPAQRVRDADLAVRELSAAALSFLGEHIPTLT